MGVNHVDSEAASARRIRWHRHVLGAIVVWSLMFVASEAFRIYTMHKVEALNADGECDTIIRHPALEEDSPSLFRKLAERAGGDYWNRDFCSIVISRRNEPVNDELITNIARLNRLSTLQISGAKLTEQQLDRLATMKHLQWLAFSSTNVDQAAAARLRQAMPNTFVTH